LPGPALAAVAAQPLPSLTESETETDHDSGHTTGVLVAGDETVRFRLRRHATPGRPMVLLVPILAGGEDLMDQVANRLVDRGFDTALCARVGPALKPPQRAAELDDLFRRTVLHQRLLLHWLRHGDAPPEHIFVLGISLGGMVATVLTAVEPTLSGTALVLSGAGIADLVVVSSEPRVQAWRRWRHTEDAVGDDHLRWELGTRMRHEPLRFAGAIATRKVLFVGGIFDTVVPAWHQDLLWEALGRPARLDVPLGHYSAALAIGPILDAAANHFRDATRQ
jgi:pimeloyl-ACP methyl ester carboxylesterase